jgi:uncharacterized Ntn-hydrolase superfamily protein
VLVVRAERSRRPWRDSVIDHRVDDHPDPVAELDRLVATTIGYQEAVLLSRVNDLPGHYS